MRNARLGNPDRAVLVSLVAPPMTHVSQIVILTRRPSASIDFETKSTPIVGCSASKVSLVKRRSKLDFPVPESPTSKILNASSNSLIAASRRSVADAGHSKTLRGSARTSSAGKPASVWTQGVLRQFAQCLRLCRWLTIALQAADLQCKRDSAEASFRDYQTTLRAMTSSEITKWLPAALRGASGTCDPPSQRMASCVPVHTHCTARAPRTASGFPFATLGPRIAVRAAVTQPKPRKARPRVAGMANSQ